MFDKLPGLVQSVTFTSLVQYIWSKMSLSSIIHETLLFVLILRGLKRCFPILKESKLNEGSSLLIVMLVPEQYRVHTYYVKNGKMTFTLVFGKPLNKYFCKQ